MTEERKPLSRGQLILLISAFVFCGTSSTMLSKICFQTESTGLNDDRHAFKKPLFQNASMFLGMSLCVLVYQFKRCMHHRDEEARVESLRRQQQQEDSANGQYQSVDYSDSDVTPSSTRAQDTRHNAPAAQGSLAAAPTPVLAYHKKPTVVGTTPLVGHDRSSGGAGYGAISQSAPLVPGGIQSAPATPELPAILEGPRKHKHRHHIRTAHSPDSKHAGTSSSNAYGKYEKSSRAQQNRGRGGSDAVRNNRSQLGSVQKGSAGLDERDPEEWRAYYRVAAPAACDFVATQLQNVALLWINASIWQMVRGSIILWTAAIRFFWLRRGIQSYQWFGVLMVMGALVAIGVSSIYAGKELKADADAQNEVSSQSKNIAGIFLVVVAQLIQALQTVIEEHLLHDVNTDAMLIVGLEGVWGFIFCAGIGIPIAQFMHGGHEGDGLHENTLDSFEMLKNNHTLLVLNLCYVVVILLFNTTGMSITLYTNSVTRNIVDTVRTMFIWVFLTITHYEISDQLGEAWTEWGFLELGGFLLLVSGVFTYNSVWQLPCFDYPQEKFPQAQGDPPPAAADGGTESEDTNLLESVVTDS